MFLSMYSLPALEEVEELHHFGGTWGTLWSVLYT